MQDSLRHALIKQAFIGTALKTLWASKPVQWLRLVTYGGGPQAQRFLGRFKSPFAFEAAKQGLTFGSLGGMLNIFAGDPNQSWAERYVRGFIPGAASGIGWGLGTTALRAGAAKLLPKTFSRQAQPQGIAQRIGAWGRAGMEATKREQRIAKTVREAARGGAPKAVAERVKKMEAARVPFQEYGKFKDILRATRGDWAERIRRLTPYFLGGVGTLTAGIGASYLAEKPFGSWTIPETTRTLSGMPYTAINQYGLSPYPSYPFYGRAYY